MNVKALMDSLVLQTVVLQEIPILTIEIIISCVPQKNIVPPSPPLTHNDECAHHWLHPANVSLQDSEPFIPSAWAGFGLKSHEWNDYRIFVSSSISWSNRNRHLPADMRQHKQSLKDEPVFFYLLLLLGHDWIHFTMPSDFLIRKSCFGGWATYKHYLGTQYLQTCFIA